MGILYEWEERGKKGKRGKSRSVRKSEVK